MDSCKISRRDFIKQSAAAASAVSVAGSFAGAVSPPKPAQHVFPRWRGFNLLSFFTHWNDKKPLEDDFKWMRDWGFNFIRLPMSYWTWSDKDNWDKIEESTLEQIDKVVDWGRKYSIHISLNFHRGPGYCVNPPEEKLNLFKDKPAEDAFCRHWEMFAQRYKGISSERVSFDLLNEPRKPNELMSRQDYERVMRRTTGTIRSVDPDRLVIVDGLSWGNEPVEELVDLGVGQSTRGYQPMQISHYKASWVNGERFPDPVWPDKARKTHKWDKQKLVEHYQPWVNLAKKGVGVHCGECGCYNKTPHDVFLAWFRDVLEILTRNNIGYSVWNLRGSFGLVDSKRDDVEYEDFHGHQLDKKFLDLLKEF